MASFLVSTPSNNAENSASALEPRFLEAAERIGVRLARTAIWSDSTCSWLGPLSYTSAGYGAIGSDLYSGCSGIALFLGQLYALTGVPLFRRTALGALQCAIDHPTVAPDLRCGLYSGWLGIAYAANEVARLCDYPAASDATCYLIARLFDNPSDRIALDVIGGAAGAIPVLLHFYANYRWELLLDLALRLGDHLLNSVVRRDVGWAWDTTDTPTRQPLNGFAHGAAGIAWGLLELWRVSGATAYRVAAEYGFAYEQQWFDPELAGWPDFRCTQLPAAGSDQSPISMAWCHGAAGGALARLRAHQITGNVAYRHDAEVALAGIRHMLAGADEAADFSLCHGRAGQADVLLTAAAMFADVDQPQQALELGDIGIERLLAKQRLWPCGLADAGETPGLMLGLAGIGYFYLRLYAPTTVPSLLLPAVDSASFTA